MIIGGTFLLVIIVAWLIEIQQSEQSKPEDKPVVIQYREIKQEEPSRAFLFAGALIIAVLAGLSHWLR
jgi:hypothetical protein